MTIFIIVNYYKILGVSSPITVAESCTFLLRIVHTFRFSTGRELTGRARAQFGTLITSPVLSGESNEQERCDQTVVHAQRSAKDRNPIIALFLLYRRKRRRNRLHWFHPIIQKNEFGAFCTLFGEVQDDANMFLNYFRKSVSSFDEMHRCLKESFQRHNSKIWNWI
jgi:hypothetical protein